MWHLFCLWLWLHRQHFVNLCRVKRLTKLHSVPNICGGPKITKKRDKHIRQFAAPSRCWKGSYNILQHQAKRPENLKVFDRMQTNSSNQVKQPLCGSFPKCECSKNRMTMRQHEGQGTAMNNRERPCMGHEWAMNDHKWRGSIHPTPAPSIAAFHRMSGTLSSVFGLSCTTGCSFLRSWQTGPILLAIMVLAYTHTHDWAYLCFIYASIFHI